jgi:hypothetical protein
MRRHLNVRPRESGSDSGADKEPNPFNNVRDHIGG